MRGESADASGGSLSGQVKTDWSEDRDAARTAAEGASMAPEGEPVSKVIWLSEAERELRKVPFFVRGKAKRNTEAFAAERGLSEISRDILYEAKAHYAR